MNRVAVRVACAASLFIGLFFVFVWAPHPWGWVGFDQYYDLARALARGEPFPTTDVPWGYAYYLSVFYRLFGERLWIPLLAQVFVNAAAPALAYGIARRLFDDRVATLAAVLIGFMSFNTVYASTQSSDAICNVMFIAGVLAFVRGRDSGGWLALVIAGVIFGVTPQFRPNLILVPALLAAFLVAASRDRLRATGQAVKLVAASMLMLTPWLIHTYRLTGEIMPTSTHGGVQLWYGTLQAGPYLQSRAHNPRSVFEFASFPYTSLDRVPLVVSGRVGPCARAPQPFKIVYWTDRNPNRRSVATTPETGGDFRAEIPVEQAPVAYYYYVDPVETAPAGAPHVFFVSSDHLGDLDRHDDLLDIFDVLRLMRHAAWNEPVAFAERLDLDHDGTLTGADAAGAARVLAAAARPLNDVTAPHVSVNESSTSLVFQDGSTIAVPHVWTGRLTDVGFTGPAAEAVLRTAIPFSRLEIDRRHGGAGCDALESIGINTVFYREQPHMMRRYMALAFDNIRRDPAAYAASMLYRSVRVFFIEGSDDPHTTHQFSGGGRVYQAAFAVSIVLLGLALAGMWLAWLRGAAFGVPALLIAYIPATLAFVLTNMRYSITVQPLLFMFVAVTIVTVLERTGRWPPLDPEGATAGRYHAGTQTARRP